MSSNSDVSNDSTSEEEVVCLICGGEDETVHDKIVMCDGNDCDIPVHQSSASNLKFRVLWRARYSER